MAVQAGIHLVLLQIREAAKPMDPSVRWDDVGTIAIVVT
jgi:hypothetical protein